MRLASLRCSRADWLRCSIRVRFPRGAFGWGDWFVNRCDNGRDASILAEVQALVTPTMFGNAKRTTTGLDFNRAS